MRLRTVASTKPGFCLPVEDALLFSGHCAGICYMPDDFDAILNESATRTMGRVNGTIGSGHHSVSGNPSYNFVLEGVPKIIAMILNNEHDYNTSEKSARYTIMETSDEEQVIYEKWSEKLKGIILAEYPTLDAAIVKKLALENARYFISVFTPATTMEHCLDLRQANYIRNFCLDFVAKKTNDPFEVKLKPWLAELASLLEIIAVDGMVDNKGRKLSLFADRSREELFDECYSINYKGTFAQLAQAQRHRTLWYEMTVPDLDYCEFYVPPILSKQEDIDEWLADMISLKENYPQGMLININERGTAEMFLLKCHERLCGAAQLEICTRTSATLNRYALECKNYDVREMLRQYYGRRKCTLGSYRCNRPCPLGPSHVFDRKI
ncbi:MAG: FAD-dependent thymidylate synthase [Candidatus Saccharibacteria bacterium]|nr:FAD-dependent thymidylate synthase [Candidatus Saccharibacteria bacterium]